jgi:hypothetical protein
MDCSCCLVIHDKVQEYLSNQNKQSSTTTTNIANSLIVCNAANIDYYRIPIDNDRIVFVDSMITYEKLLARLCENEHEDLCIGFDCKSPRNIDDLLIRIEHRHETYRIDSHELFIE